MISQLSHNAGEVRSEGAIGAAQDPNTKVNAHEAEQTLVNESKKAGIGAYQFDPNASPEEKAAQAASVYSLLFVSHRKNVMLNWSLLASSCRFPS